MVSGDRERLSSTQGLVRPDLWVVAAIAIAGYGTLQALAIGVQLWDFPFAWQDRFGEVAGYLAPGSAFIYMVATLALLAAFRVAAPPLARPVAIALSALSVVMLLLSVVAIWHYVSFHVHGTGNGSQFGVSVSSDYPWEVRARFILESMGGLGLSLVTVWLLRQVLRPAPGARLDDRPEPVDLTSGG